MWRAEHAREAIAEIYRSLKFMHENFASAGERASARRGFSEQPGIPFVLLLPLPPLPFLPPTSSCVEARHRDWATETNERGRRA